MPICIFPFVLFGAFCTFQQEKIISSSTAIWPVLFSQSIHKGTCTSSCASKSSETSGQRLSRRPPNRLFSLSAICKCSQDHSDTSVFRLGNRLPKIFPSNPPSLGVFEPNSRHRPSKNLPCRKKNAFSQNSHLRSKMPLCDIFHEKSCSHCTSLCRLSTCPYFYAAKSAISQSGGFPTKP